MSLPTFPGLQLVWYKRDLRTRDHEPLARASRAGPVLALYVHEPSLIGAEDFAAQHSGFVRECLDELDAELRALGGRLLELVGEAVDVLEALHARTPLRAIWAHQETNNALSFARDRAVRAWAQARGVALYELEQNGVKRGSAYRREGFDFSKFIETCGAPEAAVSDTVQFAAVPFETADPRDIPRGRGRDKPARQKGGSQAARHTMDAFFVADKLDAYPGSISSPLSALEGCSRMSPFLSFGVVSVRQLVHRMGNVASAVEATRDSDAVARMDVAMRFFIERMYWRSAYHQAFETNPDIEHTTQHPALRGVREGEFNEQWFEAWKAGRTGLPMVDAAMRMLEEHGWINMRARGMVMSFAANELWLHWREPSLHLARQFLDFDCPIQHSQAQIHSGTSLHSGPLMYNPVKQARDHDPQGVFVRRWVPELAKLPTEMLFEPWKTPKAAAAAGVVLGQDYPFPVVNHQAALDAARVTVMALREGRPVPRLAYVRERARALVEVRQPDLFG